MTAPKQIAGTPADLDMVRPFGLSFVPKDQSPYDEAIVRLTVPDGTLKDGVVRFARTEYSLGQFYELRESVEELYQHIRAQDV